MPNTLLNASQDSTESSKAKAPYGNQSRVSNLKRLLTAVKNGFPVICASVPPSTDA